MLTVRRHFQLPTRYKIVAVAAHLTENSVCNWRKCREEDIYAYKS